MATTVTLLTPENGSDTYINWYTARYYTDESGTRIIRRYLNGEVDAQWSGNLPGGYTDTGASWTGWDELEVGGPYTWKLTISTYPGDVLEAESDTWSFSKIESGLSKATNPTPENGSGPGIDFSDFTFSWDDNGAGTSFEVYLGTSSLTLNKYADTESTNYTPALASAARTFLLAIQDVIYWRIDSSDGVNIVTGDVWSFDPRPGKATTPSPEDASTDQKLSQTLRWTDGGYADSYDIYINDTESSTGLTSAEYDLPESYMSYLNEISWKIDSTNQFGTTEGDTWTFSMMALDSPLPTYFYPAGPFWYILIWDGTDWGNPPPTGTEDVDYIIVEFTNELLTKKRLVAAARDRIWFES